jgi:sulfoxide reductase heme-binding subunit YedZ
MKIQTILTSNRVIWICCSIPLLLILGHVYSPDFWHTSLVYAGFSAVAFLAICLASSPLSRTFPQVKLFKILNREKRETGLAAFYYALLHVFSYYMSRSPPLEMLLHPVIIPAEIALLILFAMTLTSNNFSKKKLGWKKWKSLHRMVYIAEGCVFVHMALQGGQVLIWALIIFIPLFIIQRLRIHK